MNEILSPSDENTLYFPLPLEKSLRFVKIEALSNHKPHGFGGLQYFSENTVGSAGESYQGENYSL